MASKPDTATDLYIGLMSGTSLDGIDAVLVDFSPQRPNVLGHISLPFPVALRDTFTQLQVSGLDELHLAALAANHLSRLSAQAITQLLTTLSIPSSEVRAVGSHGQTVRHRPQAFDGVGYTLQLNQPALLAELTGIDVVADFRSRDVAAGGQGAPLVPPFHRDFFYHPTQSRAVLNVGGISNITLWHPDGNDLQGFDCGPGNTLMDTWCHHHTGHFFDANGAWAAGGSVHEQLLARMLQDPYFHTPPPKSTGRDVFNWEWLKTQLHGCAAIAPQDIQATLTELTAVTCANCVPPDAELLLVCGGGALNNHLMHRLQAALPKCSVQASDAYGLPALQVEATAFAWLARQAILRQFGSDPKVTGAQGARVLGAIYPR